jgi:hypothetical protein
VCGSVSKTVVDEQLLRQAVACLKFAAHLKLNIDVYWLQTELADFLLEKAKVIVCLLFYTY